MPIYEYQCVNCNHTLELIQKVSDAPETLCPECKEDTLKKLVSAPQFKLKGTGWYETDFKSKPKVEDKKSDSGQVKEKSAASSKKPVSKGSVSNKSEGKK